MSKNRQFPKKSVFLAVILVAAVVFLGAGIGMLTQAVGSGGTGSTADKASQADATTLAYSNDNVEVTATIPEEAGLPEDVQVVAERVDSDSDAYAQAVEAIESQLGDTLGINAEGTKTSYILYDVSLQSGGEEVEPEAGSVTVDMAFAEAIDVGAYGDVLSYEVVHITDDGVAEIVTDYVNVNDNGEIEGFGFTQESFSTVAVVLGSTQVSFDEDNAIDISSSSDIVSNFEFDIDIITSSGTSTATDIRSGSSYQIFMHIDFADSKVDTTATYSIDISDVLEYLDLDTDNIPTSADDCDPIYEGSDIVGYWYVDTTTGTLYFVLSELTSTSNVWAEFTLGASASSSITSGSDKETVTIEIGGGTWTGTYLGDQSSISAQKEIMDSSINADEGTYTYSVTLTSDGTTVLTSLVDSSSSYLSWSNDTDVKGQLSTITITGADGSTLTLGTDYEVSYNTYDGTATITFLGDGLTLTDGQTITLTYTMTYDATDAPTSSITNENTITAHYTTNWDNNTSTSVTTQDVQIVNHGTVTKDGVASDDYNEVTWTITVYAGDNGYLDDYTLKDTGASGMELELVDADSVAGTSANYSVVITYVDANNETQTYTLTDDEAKALIKDLDNGTTNELRSYVTGIANISSVVVTYVTADDGTHGNTTYTSTNTVELIDGGTSVNKGEDSVPGLGEHEDRGEITKELTGTTDTTASWTSTITIYPGATLDYYRDEVNYGGWLSSGHRVEEDSLNLTVTVDGVELDSSLYTVTFDSLSGFTVDFDPDIVNTEATGGDDVVVVLTYTTVFDSVGDSGTYLYNHGKAYFTNDSKEASDSTALHNYLSKTETSYSNEDGSITWKLSINLAEIAKDYYILYTDSVTGEPLTNSSGNYYGYWGTLPESILVTDYLPEGMTITSLSYYVASYDWIENGGSKQTYNSDGTYKDEGSIAGFSGLTYKLSNDGTYFTVDLASLLSYLTNFYQWNPYVLTSSNGAIVELTYTTTVTDYAEYLTYSKKTYTNSAEISIGGSLLASDSESYTLNPESKLEKTHTVDSYVQGGTSSGSNYITFTVSDISTLVSDYVNSESLKGTTWESVTFVDVYGSDLAYDAGKNFDFQIALSSSSVSVSNSYYFYDTNDNSIIYYTFVLSDSTTIKVTVSATKATHTINFTMSASDAQLIDSISYKLRTQTSSGEIASNYDETNSIYMKGYKETETTDQVTEQISWSGASAGSTGGTLHLVKTDLYDSDTVLGGAEFSLYEATYDSTASTNDDKLTYDSTVAVATATTLENTGTWTFTGLTKDTLYALVETKAPEGYTADETVYYIYFCEDTTSTTAQELTALGVHCYTLTSTNSDGKLTVTNTKDNTTSVSVNKQWLTYTGTDVTSSTSDPEYVQVRLIRKAVAYGSSSSGTSEDDNSEVTVTVYEGSYWGTSKTEKYSKTVSDGEDVTITITASMTENSTWGGIYADYVCLEGGTSISGYKSTGGTPSDYNLGTTATLTYTIPSSLLTGNIEVYYTTSSNMSLIEDGISITQASDNPSAGTQTDDPMATTVIGTYYLRASNNWSRTISDLPLYATTTDTKGNTVYLCEYYYYFEELTTLDDYTTTYSDNNTTGVNEKTDIVTISNQAKVEKADFSVKKTWSDDSGDNQSAVTVEIYKASDVDNGTVISGASAVETLVLSKDNDWTATVTDLDKYESDGKTEIKYVAVEVTSITGYTVSYSSNNTDGINEGEITVTNTHDTTGIDVTKTWADSVDNSLRPESITVELYADGVKTDKTLTLNAANSWSGTFNELAKYTKGTDGKLEEIAYTVKEVSVEGYTTTYSDNNTNGINTGKITITNTLDTTSIDVTKTWVDSTDSSLRPESITVELYADGVATGDTLTLTKDNSWSGTFDDLAKYTKDTDGNLVKISYTVKEITVNGYTTTYSNNGGINEGTIEITNTLDTTSIDVTKTWADSADSSLRPESITVELYADGVTAGKTVKLNAANSWTGTFDELAKYTKDGDGNLAEISYTVKEISVEGYTTSYSNNDGINSETIKITNTLTGTIDITGTKTWNDNNNQDGKRPTSITIRLYADGQEVDSQTVTANDNWTWSFANLDKYNNGVKITYTITEDAIDDYTSTVNGYDVTNSYTPGKTSISVTKAWEDSNNQDGIRPTSVTVVLVKNGEETAQTVELSETNSWTANFKDLDEYTNGTKNVYTVKEVSVNGYTVAITGDATQGYTITNTHTPETTEVSGTKTWSDNDNQDGKRPTSITINLLANEKLVESQTVTEDANGNWTYSFTDLPKYENGEEITYRITEETVENYSTTYDGYNVTNSYTPGKTSISVSKVWDDSNNQDGIRPTEITVVLLKNNQVTGLTLKLNAENNWTGSFTDLEEYTGGKKNVYTVGEVAVTGYSYEITGNETDGYTITNTHTPETTEITITKIWDDNDDQDGIRPDNITINLLADGVKAGSVTVTANANGNWTYTFTDLPKYAEGNEIEYTITEDAVDGYTTTITGDVTQGYTITNTHAPETIGVGVSKAWNDNKDQDGIRPETITVVLVKNGTATDQTLTLSANDNWSGSFTGLDKYTNGVANVYTIQEMTVDGYDTVITGNASTGYVITNTHTPEKTEVSGTKTWDDNNNQDNKRPTSITINLRANGEQIDSKVVTAKDDWSYTFTDLDKYANGKEIVYSIIEEAVTDYSATYDGYNVTNSYTPGKTSINVTKSWIDADDQDGCRPDSITVVLLKNGDATDQTLTLSAENNWTGSFANLDEYTDGKPNEYTIDEVAVDGYTSVITGDASTGYVITNTHETETVNISGTKTWEDDDNQDGKRPKSITINLYANGKKIATKIVTEDNDWSYEFTDLDKYADGKEISYTIEEEEVAGYTTTYDGYNVTNSYTPGKTNIGVSKVWDDANDQDGKRPDAITVILLKNGKETEQTLTLSEDNGWTGSFTNLDKYTDGKKNVYTIKEVEVDGYTSVITGDASTGYVITNTHETETVDVGGTKTWDDNNNQDGKRPMSITINLLANGEEIDSQTVTADADGNWTYSFTNLPKYADGKKIEYSITEDVVADYSASYDGYNVKNSYTPGKTSIGVIKTWNDADDQDGIRPESITVVLLKNGEETDQTLTLNADNNWTGSFTNLDEYTVGKANEYTIQEVSVTGYTSVITGDASVGYVITNTHETETVEVSGTKTWDDNDDQDGKRPTSITIYLLADGEIAATKTVTADDNWSYSFTGLDKYKNGKGIVYSITEETVADYSTSYDGYNVTNSYTPGKTSISVTKAWYDTDDQDGIRPESITVVLVKNSEATDLTLVLSAANNWTDSFTDLNEYTNGVLNVYTVQEISVDGYISVVTGDAESGYIITNTHETETVDISGIKTWLDSDDKAGLRPDSITINLLADGVVVDSKVVTADDDWTYSFTGLAKYANGEEIVYTITEDPVDNYSTYINGYNVTNTVETTETETGEETTPDTEDETDSIEVETEDTEEEYTGSEEDEDDDTEEEGDSEETETDTDTETEETEAETETGNKKTGDMSSLDMLLWMLLGACGVTCIYTADRRRKAKR